VVGVRRVRDVAGTAVDETPQISDLAEWVRGLDEPTTGLHPHDIQRMNDLLPRLRDKGNTVLVVEHEPETIAIADPHVVDLGPGAGHDGGRIVFEGTPADLVATRCAQSLPRSRRGRRLRLPGVGSRSGRRAGAGRFQRPTPPLCDDQHRGADAAAINHQPRFAWGGGPRFDRAV